MMHTRRARFCRLVRRGIVHQESTYRGFRALTEMAPNMDVAAQMRVLAGNARTSIRALRRIERMYCLLQNGTVL